MINYIKKDITTVEHGIIAHGCNCKGVMGSGVAYAIRCKWPNAFDSYASLCELYDYSANMLGLVHYVAVEHDHEGMPTVLVANMLTQHSYGRDGRQYADLEAIATCIDHVFRHASDSNDRQFPVYMPRVGCGLGGLNWDKQVGPVVEQLAKKYPTVEVNVCDWQ